SLVLLYPDVSKDSELCRIMEGHIERHLEPRRFHRLKENSTVIIPGANSELFIQTKDLWFIYNMGVNPRELPLPETTNNTSRLHYRNRCFYLESGNKSKQNIELALDEAPANDINQSVFNLLTNDITFDKDLLKNNDFYLCKDKIGLSLLNEASGTILLHFHKEEELLTATKSTDTEVFINRILMQDSIPFALNLDVISIGDTNYLINRNWELIEIPIQIGEICVSEVSHTFKEGKTALSSIAFRLPKGSMMAIMGPSGSGKTTLLQVLLGDIKATHSKITIDGMDFCSNFAFFQKHIGYVPQDDLLFPNLTVYENLLYRIRLALPSLKNKSEIHTRIENLLHSVGLFEQRNMLVGDVMNKKLSGGQRRRLNIALELVLNPMIIILDEPTSGLSSKDSENIAEFLSDLKEQNKIILCTIHQPNATVFNAFDKVLLLDKGGVQVFFGDSKEVFNYFSEELKQSENRREYLTTKYDLRMPDYFYDLIETTDRAGNRRFPPDYWERKYRNHRFRLAMDTQNSNAHQIESQKSTKPNRKSLHHAWRNTLLLTMRNFINKSRSKINLMMTLLVAPLLAAITAFVLRGVPDGKAYSFFANENSLLFGFISIIIFIFIGLANSIDDILSEKRSIVREMKLNIPAGSQLISKHIVLLLMTIVQVVLYYQISAWILNMRGYFYPQSIFLLLSGITGYGLGLLFSSIIKDRSAIINILPLVIIPQIMFSGAVIQFSKMNASLRINHNSEIPEFCHLVPSRWLFEGWVIASARKNTMEREKESYMSGVKDTSLSYKDYMHLVDTHNAFLDKHPEARYNNEALKGSVKMAHGEYLNNGRNSLLSHRIMLFGKEYNTVYLDAIVSLIMIF
ncbi:MAG: ATP-binding cassette domain-containing protein, partial [Candidatus Cloacimonetes bacterium]|nr:ATP-binding cassette domain-containing protein [Candidatus Cloacimonadota bacterium]